MKRKKCSLNNPFCLYNQIYSHHKAKGGLFCFVHLFVLCFDWLISVASYSISCLSAHWLGESEELGLILDLL